MKMIKRAKDHVSAAFHCALFHGHRMKRSGNGTNEFMQMSRKWKRANGNSTALCPPEVGETWKKEGSPSLLGSVIIFVTHIAVWRLFSALSAQLSSVDEDSSSAVSSASSFSTAALLLCFPLLLRMPPATRIQFVKRLSVPERNEME